MFNTPTPFYLMWLFIVCVSVHDGFLVLVHRPAMRTTEENPLGRWLIYTTGDIWWLLAIKAAGTIAAATVLLAIYSHRPRMGFLACAGVAVFQLGLLLYLYH